MLLSKERRLERAIARSPSSSSILCLRLASAVFADSLASAWENFRPRRGVQLPLGALFWVVGTSVQPDALISFVRCLLHPCRRDGSFLIRAGQHLHLASVRVEHVANASSIPSTSFSSRLVSVGFVGTHKCIP